MEEWYNHNIDNPYPKKDIVKYFSRDGHLTDKQVYNINMLILSQINTSSDLKNIGFYTYNYTLMCNDIYNVFTTSIVLPFKLN